MDVLALADYLIRKHITVFIIGRGKDNVGTVDVKDNLVEVGVQRMNDGEWWLEYRLCSPGCARVLRGKKLRMQSCLEGLQYEGNLFDLHCYY